MASDDLFYVEVLGDRNLLRNLYQMPDTVREILVEKVTQWTEKLKHTVEENIQTRLRQKSGKLLSSVDSEVIDDGKRVDGRVFIHDVPYAKAQDQGATVGPHMIYPNKGKVLAFYGATGQKVFATRVSHPGGHIPASYYMKDAYREQGPEISRGIKMAVIEGIRAKMRAGL